MFKLSGWVWIVVGLFVGGSIFGYFWFQHYSPDEKEAANLNTYGDQLQAQANLDQATKDRIDKAIEDVERITREWNDVVDAKMQNDDAFPALDVDPWQLVVNTPAYRNKVQRAVNRQVKAGGVTVVQGPEVVFPGGEPGLMASYFNFGASRLPFPVVVFELGTVTIRGSMEQIVANVEAWSDMPDYFAVADGLAITGTDSDLTATYNVVILGYLPGPASGPLGAGFGGDSSQTGNAGTGRGGPPPTGPGGAAPPPSPGGGGPGSIPPELGGRGGAGGR